MKDSDVTCLKLCFDAHAEEGKITLDKFDAIVKSSGCRFLERELQEYMEEMAPHVVAGKAKYVDWSFTKSLMLKPSMLKQQWGKAAETDKNLRHDITTNVFEQMVESVMLLTDTNGEGGMIDVSVFEYVLASCGEELEGEVFEDVMKIMGHSSKGKFDVKKLIRAYGELGRKVGCFNDDDLDQMEVVINSVNRRIAEKKAKIRATQARRSGILEQPVLLGVSVPEGDEPDGSELSEAPEAN